MSLPAAVGARRPPLGHASVGALAAVVAVVALLPAGYVLAHILGDAQTVVSLLDRPRVAVLLGNTVLLVTVGTAACVAVGTCAAWFVERTSIPLRPLWTVLMSAPLAVPAFVNSFGWFSLSPSFAGLDAALLVTTLSYYPLVYLPVAAVLRGTDPALEEQARSLGNGSWATFRRVVLPQLRPAMAGGGLLVGLHLLAEFGALQSLRFDTFTTAIYDQYQSTFNGSAATALAGVLILLCLLLLGGELAVIGRYRVARVGGGAARPPLRHRLGPVAVTAATLGLAGLAAAALGVPLGCVGYWLATSASTEFPAADLARAAGTSVTLGLLGAAVTTVVAAPVAWLSVRRPGRVSRLIERATYTGNSLPGIVVALALITIGLQAVPALYQTTPMLLTAYAVLFMPRAVVSLRAALAQCPPELDDIGRSLGVPHVLVLMRVTVPLVARGIGAGATLVFLAVVTELTSTLLLAPIGTRTLATGFWANSSELHYGQAAPYALLMIVVSAPAAYLLSRHAREVPG
ncbi:ABC transporter permease [Virgisporangium aurantiacum]|uniref:Iron ABC transporter permease n=1 Tax=Virgisporangium aurantiacum TaxID=175570 RepID=A0A8J3YYN8_9ACTN|nr:iron ABC transporter permease [Virgisporangium aurantiacum]GIJ54166.1 iron ABC transporter permease [Virgisporangium aurantiacum]